MNPERGFLTWHTGFSNLVDVLIALHTRDELELETMNEASKACSECWSVAGTWRGLDESRALVRGVAVKLRSVGCSGVSIMHAYANWDCSCSTRMDARIKVRGSTRQEVERASWMYTRASELDRIRRIYDIILISLFNTWPTRYECMNKLK